MTQLSHISRYTFSSLAARGFGFAVLPIYTHFLSPEEYGILELTLSAVVLALSLIGLGWDSTLLRFLSDPNVGRKERLISSVLLIRLCGYVCLAFLYILLDKQFLAATAIPESYGHLVWLALASFFLGDIVRTVQLLLRSKEQSTSFLKLEVSYNATKYLLAALLLMILGGVWSVLFAYVVAGCVVIACILRKLDIASEIGPPSRSLAMEAVRYGGPLVPATIAMAIVQTSDRLMLAHLLPDEGSLHQVGIYSFAANISLVLTAALAGFRVWWAPYVYKDYGKPNSRRTFAIVLQGMCLVLVVFASAIIFFADTITQFFAPAEYYEARWYIVLLTAASAIYIFADYSPIGISIAKANYYRAVGGVGMAFLNILLNIILIPKYQVLGAIIATTVSFFIYGVYLQIISQRLYAIRIKWIKILFLFVMLWSFVFSASAANLTKLVIAIGFYSASLLVFRAELSGLARQVQLRE